MHAYKTLLVALVVVLFSPFAEAGLTSGMSQDEVAAEVGRILKQDECNDWRDTRPCQSLVDTIAENALDAGIESGIIIVALRTAGVPIGLAISSTAQLARRTLDIITPPKTGGGPGGGVSAN